MDDPIQDFADTDFRWGDCQAIKYDPANEDVFPQPYLAKLWERTRASGRGKLGSLPMLFCGMPNLGIDAICGYLSQRAVCVVGEWRKWDYTCPPPLRELGAPYFHELGFCFPASMTITKASNIYNPQNSCMAGYGFFQDAWKTAQQNVCMYLGLAWLFHTFQLACIHGHRYADNHLTAKFTHKYGFKDVATISHMLVRDITQPIEPVVVSTLLRTDFVALTRQVLSNAREESANGRGEGFVGEQHPA